jgi:hypothetical protein
MQILQANKQNFDPVTYSSNDLKKALIAIGKKDTHLDSLRNLLRGKVLGAKKLYIFTGQPMTSKYQNSFMGYVLYKETDGTNVLEIIRRGEDEWERIEVKKKKGDVIKFDFDC